MKEKITVGKITSAVGIKGELRVYPYTDVPERFSEIKTIQIEQELYQIEKVSYRKGMVVLKVRGIEDRTAAELQRDKKLYIDKEELWEIPEDTYFVSDLLGCAVYNEDGMQIGILSDVIQNSAQDLYEIKTAEDKTFLIPAVKEFILDVDIAKRKIIVHLIEGLVQL